MPGKQNTYTLGEYGVNRVKSPLHLVDGELLTAQNADVPFEKGNRGLRKRSGMSKLNRWPLAGAIHSLSWIPIVDPLPDTEDPPPPPDPPGVNAGDLYLSTTSAWLVSADGSTFSLQTAPVTSRTATSDGNVNGLCHRDRFYFLDGGSLKSFDATEAVVTHGTVSGTILRPFLFLDWVNDLIFGINVDVGSGSSGTFDSTAFQYDVATDTFTELPGTFTGVGASLPFAVGAVDGEPYVSEGLGLGCTVARHNGTTWVSDGTLSAFGGVRVASFARGPFDGQIYAALTTTGALVPGVMVRTGPSTWSAVYTPSPSFGTDATMCAHTDGALYVADSTRRVHRSDDGSTWTVDEDLSASMSSIDALLPWNDTLFAFDLTSGALTNRAFSRDSGGTWAVVSALSSSILNGVMGHV